MTVFGIIALPFLLGLFGVLAFGRQVIDALAKRKAKQPISGDAPAGHQSKAGTPTMGGLLILGATMIAVFVTMTLLSRYIISTRALRLLAVLCTFLFAGLIGLLDDLGKTRKKENKAGLSERAKLSLQVIVAAGFLVFLWATGSTSTTTLTFGGHAFDIGPVYYLLALLYLCFVGNAANFTDGLDGLLSGTSLIAALALGATVGVSSPEIGLFYGALAGACAGFLCFNAFPAKIFMGDTGSLAIGMGLAAAALAAKQEILLLIVGLVYVVEIASMMLQRYVFKYRRIRFGIEYAKANRVFKRAPLHHHFEELGWRETQVVARFWVGGLVAAALGMIIAPYVAPRTVPMLGPGAHIANASDSSAVPVTGRSQP